MFEVTVDSLVLKFQKNGRQIFQDANQFRLLLFYQLRLSQYVVCSTYHTTLQATPGQLVFGRNLILNAPFISDREAIRKRKQQIIDKNKKNENITRKPHRYEVL